MRVKAIYQYLKATLYSSNNNKVYIEEMLAIPQPLCIIRETEIMEKTKTLISALELKRLLVEIVEKRPQVCLRYRSIGEVWQPNFMRVLKTTGKGVVLNDEQKNKPDVRRLG